MTAADSTPPARTTPGLAGRDLLTGAAVAAVLLLLTMPPASRFLVFNRHLRGGDYTAFWMAARDLVHGAPLSPYRPGVGQLFYPAPFIVLLAPLGYLSQALAGDAARVMAAVLLTVVIGGWAVRGSRVPAVAWTLALSLPVLSCVYLGQLPTATGLAAFGLAIWAQRRDRWLLVGVAVAVGLIRPANALPLLTILVVGGWGKPRALLTAAAVVVAILAPAAALVTLRDPTWVTGYLHSLATYQFGIPAALARAFGVPGLVVPQLVACWLAFSWTRAGAGGPLDPDAAAAVLALTIMVAPLSAAYAAVFGIPALLRLGCRAGMWPLLLVATAVPWLGALAPSPGPLPFYVVGPLMSALVVAVAIPPLVRQAR